MMGKTIEKLVEDNRPQIIIIRRHKDYAGVVHNPGEKGYLFSGQDHGVLAPNEAPVAYESQKGGGFIGTPITCFQIIVNGKRIPTKDTEEFLYTKGYK